MTGHLSATNEGDVSPAFHFSSSTYQNWSVQVGILRRHCAPNTLVWATKDRSFSRCNLLDKWKEQEVTSETPTSVHNRLSKGTHLPGVWRGDLPGASPAFSRILPLLRQFDQDDEQVLGWRSVSFVTSNLLLRTRSSSTDECYTT
jgi:hypothetical protein